MLSGPCYPSFPCRVCAHSHPAKPSSCRHSKRIGSDTYGLWRAAMITLANNNEMIQYKAVDDIVTALEQTWADLRTWIFLNPSHNKQKRKPKKRK